jgi:putative addiction module component (TIGR02574 family)
MHGVKEIIEEAAALPVGDRVLIVDSLLRSLNAPSADLDRAWSDVVQKRLGELRSGKVEAISGEDVVAGVRKRFNQ